MAERSMDKSTNQTSINDYFSNQKNKRKVNLVKKSSKRKRTTTSTSPLSPTSKDEKLSDVFNFEENAEPTEKQIKATPEKATKPQCTKRKKNQQLYLDFGQESFGKRITCEICKMMYVKGELEDESNHLKICQEFAKGILYNSYKRERVAAMFEGREKIIEIRSHSDPKHFLKKVHDVKSIIDVEMGFASFESEQEKPCTYYLYISKNRIVGYCSIEPIHSAYQMISQQNRSTTPVKHVQMGIRQIWCLASHRHKKIASRLVDCAREKFIFGTFIPVHHVAFSSPTSDGYAFAKKYCDSAMPLVYDYSNL